jgi:hypothetical protein
MGSSRVICLNPEAAENGQIPGISYDGGYAD